MQSHFTVTVTRLVKLWTDTFFMWQSQENMELTTTLETERHMAKELAAKLSEMGVELEESKQLVSGFRLEINKALVARLCN